METKETEPSAKTDAVKEPQYQWFEGAFDDGGKFRFRFLHEKMNQGRRVTTCFLEYCLIRADGRIVEKAFAGRSCCCPLDNFNREFGRKSALQEAMDNQYAMLLCRKAHRRAIWRCYFEMRGKKMRHEKKRG